MAKKRRRDTWARNPGWWSLALACVAAWFSDEAEPMRTTLMELFSFSTLAFVLLVASIILLARHNERETKRNARKLKKLEEDKVNTHSTELDAIRSRVATLERKTRALVDETD